ncbi:MAG: basic rane protein, partial [Fimbriimonadaceae bacterium]|nr:basic rane protein [Fimbriimonadaceae bacterium]
MKSFSFACAIVVASALLASCSPQPAGDSTAKAPFKVALLTPGPVSDAGWSAMAYDGLQQIKKDLGADVNNQEAKGTQ